MFDWVLKRILYTIGLPEPAVIRYVLAITLAVTVLGMTATALDQVRSHRAEQSIEADIDTIDGATTALLEHETPTAETAGPRRIVEVDIPERRYTVAGTERFVFEPVPDSGVTRVHYRVESGPKKQITLDSVISRPGKKTLDLSHRRGPLKLRLTLKASENGEPYVAVSAADGDDI